MRPRFLPIYLSILLSGSYSNLNAQTAWFKFEDAVDVISNSKKIHNPWAGGLNASQVLKMDLDYDGTEDLVVYDRTNSKVSTFLAKRGSAPGTPMAFVYSPMYELLFPDTNNWMILADYNGDGFKDVFASTPLGVSVFKHVKSGGLPQFVRQVEAVYTKGFSGNLNLQIGGTDIPAITDIDDDGDLDVLTFDFSGNSVELHQNLSMEVFGVPDSLGNNDKPVYVRNGECWGNFHKGNDNDFVFGDQCGVEDISNARMLHAGNSILLQDINGDGKKDLLVGHVSNDHISVLYNAAAGIAANFTSFTHNYPETNPVSIYIFPAVFMEDVDFDGVKDLIASPNLGTNDANLMNFQSSNWYYHNEGTDIKPDFKLVQKNFLQDQMLDVGENASPSFYDIDGDGDFDMIIGTGATSDTNGFTGRLWLLENMGSGKSPEYKLASTDFVNTSGLKLFDIKPQWADFNGDGVKDLGLAGTSANTLKPEFKFIPNKATNGAVQLNVSEATNILMPPESQIGDSPFFYDTDNDGDLDLLVGKPQGNISYYNNTGTNKQFAFQLETASFAGIEVNFSGRFPSVTVQDIDLDGKPDLLTADHSGKIKLFYGAEWGKWTKREEMLIDNDGKALAPRLGNNLSVAVADYNGDHKPDIAIGNNAGGVRLLTNILNITSTEPTAIEANVYPNPTTDLVTVWCSQNATLSIVSQRGKLIDSNIWVSKNQEKVIPTDNLPAGLYVFVFDMGDEKVVKKVVVR